MKEQQIHTDSPGKYASTLDFAVLACGNIEGNNNKFYCLELQKASDNDFRLFCHRGRIGTSDVYGVREGYTSEASARKDFEKIVAKKLSGKKKEGYIERYERVNVAVPTVGSPNIKKKPVSKIVEFTNYSGKERQLLELFYANNIHNLQNAGITIVNGRLETALGPVTENHIEKAKGILDLLKESSLDSSDKSVRELNSQYLSLIPRIYKVEIFSQDRLSDEYDFLDQIKATLNFTGNDLGFTISKSNYDPSNLFESTRAGNHMGLSSWKVVDCFDVSIDADKHFCDIGNIKQLWHGTSVGNILSILCNGLIIPSVASHGRMFGNGIYGAPNSTKALNYSTGFWSGTYSNSAFLFIVEFAMGKIYEVNRATNKPSGYDSIHAKAGYSLYNDECIVYNKKHQRITHLVELKGR